MQIAQEEMEERRADEQKEHRLAHRFQHDLRKVATRSGRDLIGPHRSQVLAGLLLAEPLEETALMG